MPPQMDYRLAMAQPQERFGTLKDIMAIGQLHDQDRQQQQARINAQQQVQADQIVQQVLTQYPDQPDMATQELKRRGMHKAAMGWETYLAEHRKKLAETARYQAETKIKELEATGQSPDQLLKAQVEFAKNATPKNWAPLLAAAAELNDQAAWDDSIAGANVMMGNDPRVKQILATIPKTPNKAWVTALLGADNPQKTASAGSDYAQFLARYAAGQNTTPDKLTAEQELAAKKQFFEAQRGEGSSSDFGSFLSNYMEGEAAKLGKTPDQLGASWKAGATIRARKAFGQADDAAQRAPVPIVIQTGQGPQLVDRGTGTARQIVDANGKVIDLAPTAEQRNRAAGMNTGKAVIDSIDELSAKINTQVGALAKISGAAEKLKAEANMNDDISEYNGLVQMFTPLLARAVGHTGVLTEQDVQSVRDGLPKPTDSKTIRDRKMARVRKIMAQMPGGEAAGVGQSAGGPKEGEVKTWPSGMKAVYRNGQWHEIK